MNRSFFIFSCCLTYPLQRIGRDDPARCPGCVLLWQVPFGQNLFPPYPPPPVSQSCSGISQVLQVCPTSRVRSSSAYVFGLPNAPRSCYLRVNTGSPGSLARCFHTCAGSMAARTPSHLTMSVCLVLPSASPYSVGVPELVLTRLNTRPIFSPVNASTSPSRETPHDSRSMWLAIPSSIDLAFTSPRRFPGAQGAEHDDYRRWREPAAQISVGYVKCSRNKCDMRRWLIGSIHLRSGDVALSRLTSGSAAGTTA